MRGILKIAYKLLVNDKGKFAALLLGITFAVFGLLSSLAPSSLAGTPHQPSHALTGAVPHSESSPNPGAAGQRHQPPILGNHNHLDLREPTITTYQTPMQTAQLGQTGLEITRVGFGAWAISGGNWEFG